MNMRLAILGLPLLLVLGGGAVWWAMQPPGVPAPPPEAMVPVGAADAEDADLPVPPAPPRISANTNYETCLATVDQDPDGARAMADKAAELGGVDPATHCRALALIATGDPESGAPLLDEIGGHAGPADAARAAILQQAAEAWLMADAPGRALSSANRALELSPDNADLLSLAAQAQAALAIDPDEPTALLERGVLHQQDGELAAARADWQRTIESAPESDAADLARQNIELLDAGPEEK